METRTEIVTAQISQPPVRRNRRIGLLVLKAIVAGVLMYFVLGMVDLRELSKSIQGADPLDIVIASSFLGLNLGTRALKWKMLLRTAGSTVSTREAAKSILLGITVGSFTPGQLGEVGGRYFAVPNGRLAHIVGLTMLDRTQVFLVLAMSGLTSYAFLILHPIALASSVSAICIALCLFLYMRLDVIQKIAEKLPFRFIRRDWFSDFIETFSLLGSKELVQSLFYSLAFNGVLFLQMFFFLNAFGSVDPWTAFVGFSAMMFFKSLLPISLGDIGVREASTVYFFSLLGVSNIVALSAALLMFAINVILPALAGILFIPSARFSQSAQAAPEK